MPRPGNAPIDSSLMLGEVKKLPHIWEGWFRLISALFSSTGNVSIPTVTASPFTYQNNTTFLQQAIVTGAVATVAFSRDGVTYLNINGLVVILSAGDFIRLTYPGPAKPVLTLVPL